MKTWAELTLEEKVERTAAWSAVPWMLSLAAFVMSIVALVVAL